MKRRQGVETFRDGARDLGFSLAAFWQWSCSDLVSNATRGILAEYLVAKALGVADGVREEWASFDLTAPDGTRIEVKSAAFIQSWYQERLSSITFRVSKTRAWDRESNRQSEEMRRQADVYVFAVHAHQDQSTLDPMDVSQWEFFVVPTAELDNRPRSQHSITLNSLRVLASEPTAYSDLRRAVRVAADIQKELANRAMQTDRPSAGR
ncbi:MAG: hypothetical protein IT361_03915 [Gemmatimonadaceae bacterium]|nr:hypothetical protein [Gemmatimonadaceae bacterium]